jgi:hypothetical protein
MKHNFMRTQQHTWTISTHHKSMHRSHLVIHTPAQKSHANNNWRVDIAKTFIKVGAILLRDMMLPLNRYLRQDGSVQRIKITNNGLKFDSRRQRHN